MAEQFQKGDRVKVILDNSGEDKYIGELGTVVNIKWYKQDPIIVELADGEILEGIPAEFALVETVESVGVDRKSTMDKLTTLAKKIVDADLRNMIKVGWLDNSLNLTTAGEDVVLADYLSENKAKFGKLAEEELKELRKDRESR